MNKSVLNGLVKLARFNDLLSDLGRMNGGVRRTPAFLERAFPNFTWGDSDSENGPIYLTFDDGPHPDWTRPILDVLDAHSIRGTFFLLGERLPKALEVAHDIVSRGHRIGYHGLSHSAWWFRRAQYPALESDPHLLKHLLPSPFERPEAQPLLLRPPYGRFDLTTVAHARDLQASIVLWRLVVGDWLEDSTADDIAGKLLTNTRPGDIVVLHDGGKNGGLLADALNLVIPLWQMKGFRFGDIDLIARGAKA